MNHRVVARLLGRILIIETIALALPLTVCLIYGEAGSAKAFLITMACTAAVGLLALRVKAQHKQFYALEGFVVTALSWIVISLFGALPFYLSGAIPSLMDCFFEVVSGFTTTGASILSDVEALSHGLLFWRSFTHWLGGMGVLVFLLAVASIGKGEGHELYLLKAESPGPNVGKLTSKVGKSAKILYGLYVVFSLVEVLFLLAGGMPLYDSLCTMFATAGTGGFGIKNTSMAFYQSYYLQGVVTVFMALFGVNFNIFFLLLMREFSQAWHDEELRVYLGIMLSSIALITLNILPIYGNTFEAFHQAAFQTVSIMTTTGFTTTNFDMWPEFSRSVVVLLMVAGACAGSTGGGMKTARLVIALKSVKKEISRMLHPRQVKILRMNGKQLDNRIVKGVSLFMTAYFITVAASFLIVSLDNKSMVTNLTAVLSCLNNIGPGLDLVGPLGNFSSFSNLSKAVLTLDMLLGRLEFFPVIFLFNPAVWRVRKRIHEPD